MTTLLKTGLIVAGLAGGGFIMWKLFNEGLVRLGTSEKRETLLDLPTAHGPVRLERWEQSSWGNSYRGLVLLWQGRVVDVYGHVLALGPARPLADADGQVVGPNVYPAYLAPGAVPVEPLLAAAGGRPWLVWANPSRFTAAEQPALLAALREAAPAIRARFPADHPTDPRMPDATKPSASGLEVNVALMFDSSPVELTLTGLAYADPAAYPALSYTRRLPNGWLEELTIDPDGSVGFSARAKPGEAGSGCGLGQLEPGPGRLLLVPAAWAFAEEHPGPSLAELAGFKDKDGQRLDARFAVAQGSAR